MHLESPAVLVTNEDICGIELPDHLGTAVTQFLRANRLPGPVIEIAGHRKILIATASSKALRAIDSLERSGATIYRDGATLPVRNALDHGNGSTVPPVVVIAAAVRAVTSGRGPGFARLGRAIA